MKKALRILGYTAGSLVIIIAIMVGYVKTALPNVGPPPDLKLEKTQERVARGKYLANNVTLCLNCHSTRNWTKFAGPVVAGTEGKGGEAFDQKVGFPGAFYAKNITPEGISRYTDGELFRIITTGVNKEGKAIFPIMPYDPYGAMDPEDIYSIIAYIRTLTPIHNSVPESVADFPMNIIINTIPTKANPGKRPDPSNVSAYGAYMVNASGCIICHTKDKQGQIIPELAFSGGREFQMPDGSVLRSSNITSDINTGIGNWTQEAFVNRFKSYADSAYKSPTIAKGQYNSLMPWTSYAHMTDQDLVAIYNYIHNIPPIQNAVVKFTPAAGVTAKN